MNNAKCRSCGFINFASATTCKKCTHALSGDAPAVSSATAWRDGDKMVIDQVVDMPDRCVVCNAPANGRRLPLSLSWDHKLAKAPLLVGVAKINYMETELPVGLCLKHFYRQAYSFFGGVIAFVAGFGLFIFSMTRENTVFLLSGMAVAAVILGIGTVLTTSRPIQIEKANDSRFWIKGVSSRFLARLPRWVPDETV